MKRLKTNSFYSLLMGCIMAACSTTHAPRDVASSDQLPEIYPDYTGVTIPVNIAPLDFAMADDSTTCIDVEISGVRGGRLHANGDYADLDSSAWRRLLAENAGDDLTVSVSAEKAGRWTRYRSFNIHVSRDSIRAWGLTYRRIAPGYEFYGRMGIYQRRLSTFEETALIENGDSKGMCINCHTPNQTDPARYVFHIRAEHGATAIVKDGKAELLESKNEVLGGAMVYPSWHPGGRYIAFSTNKTSQMFHLSGPKRIEVYDASSDVFIYDTETHTILNDTLTMRKYWAENCPAFSADGKHLYFTTARRQIYPTNYDQEKYSLCRADFDARTGRIGPKVDTLVSASATGKSATWPRPSHDGRYLMYTQTDYGYFSAWHPEADLWLLDLSTGERRSLDEVNSTRAESLHAWSADSGWFLFTSRRDDGLYSRIYLSKIDGAGRATKPFMLPQRDPKRYYRGLLDSYNTPEFTLQRVGTDREKLWKQIVSQERIQTHL